MTSIDNRKPGRVIQEKVCCSNGAVWYLAVLGMDARQGRNSQIAFLCKHHVPSEAGHEIFAGEGKPRMGSGVREVTRPLLFVEGMTLAA